MEAPSNPRLIRALHTLLDAYADDDGQRYRELLQALLEATLIVGVWRDQPVTRGGALLVFTDLVELASFDESLAWRAMRGDAAVRSVAAGEHDGLVLSSAGRSFELSRDDVLDLFDIDG